METITVVLLLLLAVTVSGAFTRMFPLLLPLPLVQIIFGAAIASVANLGVELQPDIFFLLFLPPLLFLDGWRIPKQGLSRDKGTILEPALGLVVFTVAGVGYFVSWAALVLVEQSRCSAAATTINRYSDCKTFLRIRMNFFEEVGSFYRYRFSRTGISAIALRRRS